MSRTLAGRLSVGATFLRGSFRHGWRRVVVESVELLSAGFVRLRVKALRTGKEFVMVISNTRKLTDLGLNFL